MSATALSQATAEPSTAAAAPPKADGVNAAKIPDTLWVIDTTAVPGRGSRTHEMIVATEGGHPIVKSFTFEPGKPLELLFAVAVKFLKIGSFRRTDEHGDLLPYHRQPKQPEELGPNEKLVLSDDQTIAKYDELSNMALLQRAIELPGGEMFKDMRDRAGLIAFLIKSAITKREANKDKPPRAAKAEVSEPEDIDEIVE